MHLAFLEEFPFRIHTDRSSPTNVILGAVELRSSSELNLHKLLSKRFQNFEVNTC